MNDYIKVGKIVNTHGIKGEIRIISECEYFDKIFKVNNTIYIGKNYTKEVINSYRHHKCFEMITLVGINDINEVLKYKGEYVYFRKNDLNLKKDEYLLEDLINLDAYYLGEKIGKIIDFQSNNGNIVLTIKGKKDIYVPKHEHFIFKIDFKNSLIEFINLEGLI